MGVCLLVSGLVHAVAFSEGGVDAEYFPQRSMLQGTLSGKLIGVPQQSGGAGVAIRNEEDAGGTSGQGEEGQHSVDGVAGQEKSAEVPTPVAHAGRQDQPGPVYLLPGDLTDRAVPRELYVFPFPDGDYDGLQGRVVLSIYVSETGEVDWVTLEESDLPEPFGLAALSVGEKARFFPARKNGEVVKALVRLEVEYAQ